MIESESEWAEAVKQEAGTVIGVLLEQHAQIRGLFAAIRGAAGERRQDLFDELRELLAVHEAGEEMVLRPVSRESAGAQVADARNHEEEQAAHVLAELEKMDVSSTQFAAKFAEFEQAVADHAAREEDEEFPAVQRANSDEQLLLLGEKLLSVERRAPTHPHPATAGSRVAQGAVAPFAALLDKARDAFSS